jgi:hypothetical protein
MEFNLQKTVEQNLFQYYVVKQTNPSLSSNPGHNFIVPGAGNVLSYPTFFVPLHNPQNPHVVTKSVELAENQEGLGLEQSRNENNDQSTSVGREAPKQFAPENNELLDPNDQNGRKRKLMDQSVLEAFVHPRFVSKTVKLDSNKVKNIAGSGAVKKETKKISHNFQFL